MWAEAARLEELRIVAREDRAEALLAGGRTAEAIAELERLTTEFPLRDHAQQKLLVALYRRAGRRTRCARSSTTVRISRRRPASTRHRS